MIYTDNNMMDAYIPLDDLKPPKVLEYRLSPDEQRNSERTLAELTNNLGVDIAPKHEAAPSKDTKIKVKNNDTLDYSGFANKIREIYSDEKFGTIVERSEHILKTYEHATIDNKCADFLDALGKAYTTMALRDAHKGTIYPEDAKDAIAVHKRAVELKPDNPDYRFNLAYAYFVSRRYLETLIELNEVLKLKPAHTEANDLKHVLREEGYEIGKERNPKKQSIDDFKSCECKSK